MTSTQPANPQVSAFTATVVAGTGAQGGGGDGGPATAALLSYPAGIAADGAGNLYIAGWHNHRVRKVAVATGVITTVAGNGTGGADGDGGPATSARLNYPVGVAVDGAGTLYITDLDSNRVRKVAAATGVITTVAGNGTAGPDGDGGSALSAQLHGPRSMAVDGAGNLYIVDSGNYRVRKVAVATGMITTVAGTGTSGSGGDGGLATSAQLSHSISLAVDNAGNLYLADGYYHRVRKVEATTGVITPVAGTGTAGSGGDGGLATSAQLSAPVGVAVDGAGNLYVADSRNDRIRRITVDGVITTVAENITACFKATTGYAFETPKFFEAMTMDGAGNLYVVSRDRQQVLKITVAPAPVAPAPVAPAPVAPATGLPASGTVVSWANVHSSLRMGVSGQSTVGGAHIQQSSSPWRVHHRWLLTVVGQDNGDDLYTIENMRSHMVVEVVGTQPDVVQRTYGGTGARHQQWKLLPVNPGAAGGPVYKIMNLASGLVLQVDTRSPEPVRQCDPQNGRNGQEWRLVTV